MFIICLGGSYPNDSDVWLVSDVPLTGPELKTKLLTARRAAGGTPGFQGMHKDFVVALATVGLKHLEPNMAVDFEYSGYYVIDEEETT